ncbi:MAG: hypothetical protein VB048_08245 [Bacteroidaceae bacterium]|nr:hypothetical protein [Bacteroidaceae bacterium]
MSQFEKCVICDYEKTEVFNYSSPDPLTGMLRFVKCPVCGDYIKQLSLDSTHITEIYDKEHHHIKSSSPEEILERKAILRHFVKKATLSQPKNKYWQINQDWIHNILCNYLLPNPIEQIDNLIFFLGENVKPGYNLNISKTESCEKLISIVGCMDKTSLIYIINSCRDLKLLKKVVRDCTEFRLSINGWKRYQNLKKGIIDSNKAFLAMKFDSKYITNQLIEQIKITVSETGYELESLLDKQKAGLIDDHLRQRIKNSKFLIVDLSDNNEGAYWESGYGEGLGKTVIYICEKSIFEATKGTHFDTNHHLTVIYDTRCTDKMNKYHINNFLLRLKDTIQESIPE